MPFPWKKAKVTRFSRLVADLHQSPKRGVSLVVETGFPTSLVDLFVKNRDRFFKGRRSSTKTKSTSPQSFPFDSPSSNEHQSSLSSEDLVVKQSDSVKVQIESNSPTICVVDNGCQNLETTSEIPMFKSDRSPGKSSNRNFIKKLVPKKLRHRKKLRKSKNKDQSGVEDVHKLDETEEEKQWLDDDDDDDDDYVDDESQKKEESCREVGVKISTCVQLLQVEPVKDKLEEVSKGKSLSGFLILILFIIVLSGLVGGNCIALLLTLVWCLVLRFIGRQCRC